jgi:serine/threonine protein kinase
MALPVIDIRELSRLQSDPLASGGRGEVHPVYLGKQIGPGVPPGRYLIKVYRKDLIEKRRKQMHEHLDFIDGKLENRSSYFSSRLARPLCIVNKNSNFLGFLMKELKSGSSYELHHDDGTTSTRLQELNVFLNSESERTRLGVPSLADRTRLRLMDDFLKTVSELHKMGLIVGDLSGKNLVLNFKPTAKNANRVVFLDVDSFRLSSKPHPLGPESTLNWRAPESEINPKSQSTKASDVYKSALVVKRFLHQLGDGVNDSYSIKKSSIARNYIISNGGQVLMDVLDSCYSQQNLRPSMHKLSYHFSEFTSRLIAK